MQSKDYLLDGSVLAYDFAVHLHADNFVGVVDLKVASAGTCLSRDAQAGHFVDEFLFVGVVIDIFIHSGHCSRGVHTDAILRPAGSICNGPRPDSENSSGNLSFKLRD